MQAGCQDKGAEPGPSKASWMETECVRGSHRRPARCRPPRLKRRHKRYTESQRDGQVSHIPPPLLRARRKLLSVTSARFFSASLQQRRNASTQAASSPMYSLRLSQPCDSGVSLAPSKQQPRRSWSSYLFAGIDGSDRCSRFLLTFRTRFQVTVGSVAAYPGLWRAPSAWRLFFSWRQLDSCVLQAQPTAVVVSLPSVSLSLHLNLRLTLSVGGPRSTAGNKEQPGVKEDTDPVLPSSRRAACVAALHRVPHLNKEDISV